MKFPVQLAGGLLQIAVLLCFVVALPACGTLLLSATPGTMPQGTGIVIRPGDLPAGWGPIGPTPLERVGQGGVIWLAAYASADDPTKLTLTVQQQLTVFQTTQSAIDAYDQWIKKWFPSADWKVPPASRFTPRDPNDNYHYACLNVSGASIVSCRQLQRHSNLVSLVIVNIDGHSMTFAQFENVIDSVDARLAASNIPAQITPNSQRTEVVGLDKPTPLIGAQSRWIIFYSETAAGSDTFLIRPDGTGLIRLAQAPSHNGQFAWSPNGQQLAFTSDRDGNAEIYTMDLTGQSAKRLTSDPGIDTSPSWSPDGQLIAFASSRSGASEIYLMHSDGTGVHQLTSGGTVNQDPSWSPDGQHIAFATTRDGHYEIYMMNVDGSQSQRLTQTPGPAASLNPKWSPDGKWIAFQTIYTVSDARISVVELSSGQVLPITNFTGYSGEPSWAPDSHEIAFSSTVNGKSEIFVINLDGSSLRQLTEDNNRHGSPAWSP